MAAPTTVRLDDHLKAQLVKEAELRGIGVSELIRQFIVAGLAWSAQQRGEAPRI